MDIVIINNCFIFFVFVEMFRISKFNYRSIVGIFYELWKKNKEIQYSYMNLNFK